MYNENLKALNAEIARFDAQKYYNKPCEALINSNICPHYRKIRQGQQALAIAAEDLRVWSQAKDSAGAIVALKLERTSSTYNKVFFFGKFPILADFVKYDSPRKILTEIFFEINFFGLKYVLKDSESIPKKIFFAIFFENFLFLAIFVKKWLSPRKKFSTGNFFRNQLFRFKIRFETF